VTQCSDAVGFQSFGGPYCLHLQGGMEQVERREEEENGKERERKRQKCFPFSVFVSQQV
jgi:hypothetical protein